MRCGLVQGAPRCCRSAARRATCTTIHRAPSPCAWSAPTYGRVGNSCTPRSSKNPHGAQTCGSGGLQCPQTVFALRPVRNGGPRRHACSKMHYLAGQHRRLQGQTQQPVLPVGGAAVVRCPATCTGQAWQGSWSAPALWRAHRSLNSCDSLFLIEERMMQASWSKPARRQAFRWRRASRRPPTSASRCWPASSNERRKEKSWGEVVPLTAGMHHGPAAEQQSLAVPARVFVQRFCLDFCCCHRGLRSWLVTLDGGA